MATAAPFVKLLRQLAEAKDDYLTGALDISWDGGKATLFLVFGQPNHAVLETLGGDRLEGQEAVAALVRQLPPRFQLSAWRKEVVRTETLTCSIEELMAPFAQRAGAAAPERVAPEGADAAGAAADPDFGLADFPLLPLGPSLWADASASVVHLDVLLPTLPDALVVLTGPKLRAAGVVVREQLIDAVWVDEEVRSVGEAAAMALMGARQGTVSGYRLETPGLAEALTMLWRCPPVYREMPAAWVNAGSLLADLAGRRRDSAIVVTGGVHGVALVAGGELVGVFTESERQPLASIERLEGLLRAPGARITLRQSPEAPVADRLPETAYHTFVAPPATAAAPLGRAVAGASASTRGADPADPGTPGTGWTRSAAVPLPPAAEPAPRTRVPPPPGPGAALPSVPPLGVSAGTGEPERSPAPADDPQPAADPRATWDRIPSPDPPAGEAWGGSAPAADPATRAPLDDLEVPPDKPDVEAVKLDLIQIGALWLGTDGVAPIAEMIRRTRSSIEDVMSTIEAIKQADLPGQEQSVVLAMTREMQFHAAEYLSGL